MQEYRLKCQFFFFACVSVGAMMTRRVSVGAMADSSQTAVAAPDHALADRGRGSPELDGVTSERFLKPKAEFEVGIPDRLPEDGQQDATTPGSGSAREETAVAATPRAKRILAQMTDAKFDQMMRRLKAMDEEPPLAGIKDDASTADWGDNGSVYGSDLESHGGDTDSSPDAVRADHAACNNDDGASRWEPSPMSYRTHSPRHIKRKRVGLVNWTAVAAKRSKTDRFITCPPGMDVWTSEDQADLRKGLNRTGRVEWPFLEEMAPNVCVGNLVISHVWLGELCKVEELSKWCRASTDHIVVVTLTKTANRAGNPLQQFMNLATKKSIHDSMLQHSGQQKKDPDHQGCHCQTWLPNDDRSRGSMQGEICLGDFR